jgi:hypothetical protein
MGLKERATISMGGPDGGSTWSDMGDGFTLQNHASVTATTTPNILPGQTITQPNTLIVGGGAAPDQLQAGTAIQTLYGAQLTTPAGLAASSILTLAVSVYRNLGLGTALASGVAITQINLKAPLISPMPSGQVISLSNVSGNTTSATLSAAAVIGQQIVFINSLTPANLYPVTSYAVVQVGNNQAFGWLNGAGGGTPYIPLNASLLMPAIAANTAITNGGVALNPGDEIAVTLVTSSSTVSVPVCNIQPLIV